MKRSVPTFFFLALLFASTLFAAPTQRYIVATRSSMALPRATTLVREIEGTPQARDIQAFHVIHGFAAELTGDEAAKLRRSVEVDYVEPVVERHALELGAIESQADVANPFGQVVPFGVDMVRAREVWPVTRGEGINVVVVDTGIDKTHPDLAGVYAGGYNTYDKSENPVDDNGHGTHVAGTIAAADNDIGVVGIAPNVRLWSVKVLDAKGSGTTDKIIAALDWVLAKKNALGGDWVLNFSLGSSLPSGAERTAFGNAVANGLLICAASGNESTPTLPAAVGYPAAYDGVLAIGAIDSTKGVASFSNQGPELAVVAPGVNVLSTVPVGTGSVAGVLSNAGSISGAEIELSGRGTVTGPFVSCGLGRAGDFPASVKGRIAIIQRGQITFNEKTHNAVSAGATAVIIYNNDPASAITWTLKNDADPTATTFNWPVTIGVSQADGQALLGNASGQITVTDRADDYESLSGTSMATPHAVGVAALVWSVAPLLPATQIASFLERDADDLGPTGFDPAYGNGLIDALNAAKAVAPSRFGIPPTTTPGPKRRAVRGH
ncbi:MAG TPA: S8 family serine peptidase [Thermoanaerobaculia bacterium]|nr:S8 family serine peptidase [Thermoanaerobaculia bacterium]